LHGPRIGRTAPRRAAGARYIAQQSEIVAELASAHLDVNTSLDVLMGLEETLSRQIAQRDRICADLAKVEHIGGDLRPKP